MVMGTLASITIIETDVKNAKLAINGVFLEMERVEGIMSHYNESSDVYQLNMNGFVDGGGELIFVVNKSLYYSQISNGAFDITVQPLLELYTTSFAEKGRGPTDEEIITQKSLVNYKNIIIEDDNIAFDKDGMKITLGAIAKGYAIDRAILELEKHGIENALVNIGGDMKAIGSKNNEPWQIALQNPRDKNEYITIIPLENQAVATSGDYERYFVENKSAHHIMDPRTGKSATDLISVTVISDNAIDGDALATSVFVLGAERGLDLLRKQNAEGLIITKDKEIIKTENFNS